MKRWGYIVFLLLAGMVGQGCSSRAIHEAEAVVAEADSLWQAGLMYGIDAGDSATLAQAYETLGAYQFLSPFTLHLPLPMPAIITASCCAPRTIPQKRCRPSSTPPTPARTTTIFSAACIAIWAPSAISQVISHFRMICTRNQQR